MVGDDRAGGREGPRRAAAGAAAARSSRPRTSPSRSPFPRRVATFDVSLVTPDGRCLRGRGRDADRARRRRRDRRPRRHAPLVAMLKAGSTRVHVTRGAEVREFATGPGFFKVEQDRALALVDDAVDAKRDRRCARPGAARGGAGRAGADRARRVRRRPLAARAAHQARREPAGGGCGEPVADVTGLRSGDLSALGGARPGDARPRSRAHDARRRSTSRSSAISASSSRSSRPRGSTCSRTGCCAGRTSSGRSSRRRTGWRRARSPASSTRTRSTARRARRPATPKLGAPLTSGYIAPLPGPRLVTLPSPFALAHGTGVEPRRWPKASSSRRSTRSTPSSSCSRSRFSRAPRTPSLDGARRRRSRSSAGGPKLALWVTFGGRGPAVRAGPRRPARGRDRHRLLRDEARATVPEGFGKLLLAGVLDARSSVLEEPRRDRRVRRDSSASAASRRSRSSRTATCSTFQKRSRARSWRGSARRRRRLRSMSSNGDIKFLTHEVGSLAKPPWLVKTSAGKPLEESDIEHARAWGEKLERRRARAARRAPPARTSATRTRSRAGRAATACGSRSRPAST